MYSLMIDKKFTLQYLIFKSMLLTCLFGISACQSNLKTETDSMQFSITQKPFGIFENKTVIQYTLSNPTGMQVSILNYGGAITQLITPDKYGIPGDVVLGFDTLSGYLQKNNPYFGSLIGRYGNRIGKGKFVLDNQAYQITLNDHGNTLHGGERGLDKVIWQASTPVGDSSLQLTYTSKEGDQGFPGNLKITVTYTLTAENALRIEYIATTDKPTPVNLTSHAYFNLSGGKEPTILRHEVMIRADQYTEVDSGLISTGKLLDVKGTPMDFNLAKPIGRDIAFVNGGYDHNWVLKRSGKGLEKIATVYDTGSGRYLELFTTEPGLQLYTGNFLDSTLQGKNHLVYGPHAALCLETQHFPDSPNQPSFPNTILVPGETYYQLTEYRFSIK